MKSLDMKKLIIKVLPFALFFYLFGKVGEAFRLAQGADLSSKLMNINGGFAAAFAVPLPSFHPQDMLVGIVGAAIIMLMLQMKKANAKKYRKGMEYGSARWGTPADIAPYIDPVFENNVLLTQTERLMMNSRPKNPAHARNKNILVIGGSGSGKTRFFVKPTRRCVLLICWALLHLLLLLPCHHAPFSFGKYDNHTKHGRAVLYVSKPSY